MFKKSEPKSFNDSSVDEILVTPEEKINVVAESNKQIYKTFYEEFGLYLSKLPNNNVKKHVQNIYNKKIIGIGITNDNRANQIFARITYDKSVKKLDDIILNAKKLGINITSGETNNIDDCIYAAYFGLIRASIILNKTLIKPDKDLHKLLTTYLYLMYIKVLGKNAIFSNKQKTMIHLTCIYIYYIYFFNEKHSYSLSVIKRDYMDIIDKSIYDEFYRLIKDNKGYSTIKDIPKLLIDLKLSFKDPKQVYMTMIKILGTMGFYTFIGPFDQFVSSMILSKYPTELFSRNGVTNIKIHNSVEDKMNKLMSKISFSK
jgi:hypothetical protein